MVLFDPFLFSSVTTLLLRVALILLVNLFLILTTDLVVKQFVWLSKEETTRSLSLARRTKPGLKTEDKKAKVCLLRPSGANFHQQLVAPSALT